MKLDLNFYYLGRSSIRGLHFCAMFSIALQICYFTEQRKREMRYIKKLIIYLYYFLPIFHYIRSIYLWGRYAVSGRVLGIDNKVVHKH